LKLFFAASKARFDGPKGLTLELKSRISSRLSPLLPAASRTSPPCTHGLSFFILSLARFSMGFIFGFIPSAMEAEMLRFLFNVNDINVWLNVPSTDCV
jgi:hypothetical protein